MIDRISLENRLMVSYFFFFFSHLETICQGMEQRRGENYQVSEFFFFPPPLCLNRKDLFPIGEE